ncbi:MAG: hypothetical protein HS122_08365 [Opitutaceae bacterium]|nr:hypothetical protein [Opitutaceae bacterium]
MLSDLLADPHENRNLARDNPELVAKLAARLDQWWLPSERKMLRRWTD